MILESCPFEKIPNEVSEQPAEVLFRLSDWLWDKSQCVAFVASDRAGKQSVFVWQPLIPGKFNPAEWRPVATLSGFNKLNSQKQRSALLAEAYSLNRQFVMERDQLKCVKCGSRRSLECHHVVHRSKQRDDRPTNLVTLCGACHRVEHGG